MDVSVEGGAARTFSTQSEFVRSLNSMGEHGGAVRIGVEVPLPGLEVVLMLQCWTNND